MVAWKIWFMDGTEGRIDEAKNEGDVVRQADKKYDGKPIQSVGRILKEF